jgi:hypothetical protein
MRHLGEGGLADWESIGMEIYRRALGQHGAGLRACNTDDDAAVAANAKAFAPALLGTTISGDLPTCAVSLAEPFPYAQGVGGLPVAVLAQDVALTRPVRYAAEVSYKVTDAEAGLEAQVAQSAPAATSAREQPAGGELVH